MVFRIILGFHRISQDFTGCGVRTCASSYITNIEKNKLIIVQYGDYQIMRASPISLEATQYMLLFPLDSFQ
jgi:hypothetical protein